MLKKYLFPILIVSISLNALECEMQIKKVKHDTNEFTLMLIHDKNCEVIMDEHTSKIVLIAKKHHSNTTDMNHTAIEGTPVDKLLTLAKSKLGDSYLYAATGPDHFDCSGFVYYLFKENGIAIPRSSLPQSKSGDKLTRKELQKGDILFFDTHARGHVNHSGVYLGDGKFIHSSSGKAYGVTISDLDKGFYLDKFRWGIRKIDNDLK